MQEKIAEVVKYVKKNFRKSATYDEVVEKYDRWGEKAQKEIDKKGKAKEKTLANYQNLKTIVSIFEFLSISSTKEINDSLLQDEKFINDFAAYEKNKIFDRNLQERPE